MLLVVLASKPNVIYLIITLIILFILALVYIATELYVRYFKERNNQLKNDYSYNPDEDNNLKDNDSSDSIEELIKELDELIENFENSLDKKTKRKLKRGMKKEQIPQRRKKE